MQTPGAVNHRSRTSGRAHLTDAHQVSLGCYAGPNVSSGPILLGDLVTRFDFAANDICVRFQASQPAGRLELIGKDRKVVPVRSFKNRKSIEGGA